MFVDASAWVAMILSEPEAESFNLKIVVAERVATSSLAIWETVRAVARETGREPAEARAVLEGYLRASRATVEPIDAGTADAAIDAHARFGKGRHPARLNMGDCFAYACAATSGLPLLYKGDDFTLTDIVRA